MQTSGAGPPQECLLGDGLEGVVGSSSSTSSNSKNLRYCLISAFFGSVRMRTSAPLVEVGDGADDRQPADELGDEAD